MTNLPPSPTEPRPRRQRHVAGSGLGLAVVAALALAACDSEESDSAVGESDDVPTVATTVPAPDVPATVVSSATTTSSPPIAVPADDAVRRAEGYLAAFASGDVDAVLELHAEDFVMRAGFPGDPLGEQSLADWMAVPYQTALETEYADLACDVGDEGASATVVDCDAALVTKIHDETNTDGVPTSVTITVTTDGIAGLDVRYLDNLGVFGFYEWRDLEQLAPEEEVLTVEEIIELGRIDALAAVEYPKFGVAAVEEMATAFNAADLDAFLARFQSGTGILGVRWSDAPEVYAALMAAGQRYELSDCEAAGLSGQALTIECGITVENSLGSSGIEPSGTIAANVAVDGSIRGISNTIEWDRAVDFRATFKAWLSESHPDVHDTATWLLDLIPSADDHEVVAPYYDEFIAQSDVYPVGG